MHIPDGYLSPETCVAMYAASVPFWYKASQALKRAMGTRMVPLISIFAAFSFTIMMLNVPIPGGTSAHAVGGTLMAIVLGPWPAIIGLSVALAIQALFFGDGGITTFGANAFNMAIALPLVGYGVYRLILGGSAIPRRRVIAAAVGSYIGINTAGLLVGLELGIQPLFWSANGQALYNPYGLNTTLPMMMFTHLTLAGMAEAFLTGLVMSYLARAYPQLLAKGAQSGMVGHGFRAWRGLVAILALFVLLTPLGLIASGTAFGEWGNGEIESLVGYVPAGFGQMGSLWQAAPLSGYQLPGISGSGGILEQAPGYVLSAVLGMSLIFVCTIALRMALARKG